MFVLHDSLYHKAIYPYFRTANAVLCSNNKGQNLGDINGSYSGVFNKVITGFTLFYVIDIIVI